MHFSLIISVLFGFAGVFFNLILLLGGSCRLCGRFFLGFGCFGFNL